MTFFTILWKVLVLKSSKSDVSLQRYAEVIFPVFHFYRVFTCNSAPLKVPCSMSIVFLHIILLFWGPFVCFVCIFTSILPPRVHLYAFLRGARSPELLWGPFVLHFVCVLRSTVSLGGVPLCTLYVFYVTQPLSQPANQPAQQPPNQPTASPLTREPLVSTPVRGFTSINT